MRCFVALLCLVASLAHAAGGAPYFFEAQPKSRGVPTGAPTDASAFPVAPLLMTSVTRYRVTLCPPAGASFTQGGVGLYFYNPRMAAWSTDLNTYLYAVTGVQDGCAHTDYFNGVRYGWLYPATNNVATNPVGATGIRVSVETDNYGL